MRRDHSWLFILLCLLTLTLICYAPALFQNRQFGYRDAGHYYYPLYERVQKEWNEWRWPLWEPEENGGMPLLGNPTAAVLYPGKIIYGLFSYPWSARLYVVAHTLLAFAGMFALMRSWGTSRVGSGVSALSYAFGAPILFQYCNIIYLVGAAWLPFGIRAVDRWLRLGRRFALLELALVLALETLGGDPEVAYVTGLCAGGYAWALAWQRDRSPSRPFRVWPYVLLAIVGGVFWTVATIKLAEWLPALRPQRDKPPPRAFLWMPYVPFAVLAAWGLVGFALLVHWRRRQWRSPLGTMLIGLGGSAVLAAALSGAQLLPVLEFTRQSSRAAGEGAHDIFPFSLEPARIAEFLWPNVFGTSFSYNRNWLSLTPPTSGHGKVWVPSLYLGGLTLVLALGAAGFRGEQPWRGWLTAIAILSLLASLGEYSGPLWWARWSPELAKSLGAHDPPLTATIRHDLFLRDGDGGFYWTLATLLPGFKQFRFPSKLLTFTALAITALAGLGWDRVLEKTPRRTVIVGTLCFGLTGAVFSFVVAERARIVTLFASWGKGSVSAFGPLDIAGAYAELVRALLQAGLVFAAVSILAAWGKQRPRLAGAILLACVTADLAFANARYILTVPQHLFEETPRVVKLIEEAERKDGAQGPYRVHRMPSWSPVSWFTEASPDRVRDFVTWERESIQPKYGLPYGIQYTKTIGVAELYDYEWFFGPFLRSTTSEAANALGIEPGRKVVVYPRRGFDMWNTRYFILPAYPGDWKGEDRGYASFIPQTEAVYPEVETLKGSKNRERRDHWMRVEDYQILRNRAAYPRAWVVHSARFVDPLTGMGRDERDKPIQEILFSDDPFWSDPNRYVYDPRTLAWMESDQQTALAPYLPGQMPALAEPVKITSYTPRRVELEAKLDRPGLVILADVYYPGWTLTIDGSPAPIYRANRMMRAAAVKSGTHRLVYSYNPPSFLTGARLSIAGMTAFLILAAWFARRRVTTSLEPASAPPLSQEAQVIE